MLSLTLLFFVIFMIATIMTGIATILVTHRTIEQLVDVRVKGESDQVVGKAYPADRAQVIARIDMLSQQRDTGDVGFLLTDAHGRFLAGNVQMHRSLPVGYSDLDIRDRIAGLTHGRAFVRNIGNGMTLTVLAETEPIQNYNGARIRIHIFGFGSIILIVIGGIAVFGLIISRRIREMRRTVDAIIDGDMQKRVPIDGSHSEFDQQARAFNRMLDRIAGLMASIANVSNDVAHDMRTPLSRLRGELALLHRRAEAGDMRDGLGRALTQSDQLLEMFAGMLRIAEVEGGDRRAAFETIDLGVLLPEIGEMMEALPEASEHKFEVKVEASLAINGDRQLLSQALINLLDNAIQYTPAGSRLLLSAERSGGEVAIIVEDDGPGIAPADHDEALRRFGRLDKSRHEPGHGLGLALVEAIARLHNGQLILEDARPGLRVVIKITLHPGNS